MWTRGGGVGLVLAVLGCVLGCAAEPTAGEGDPTVPTASSARNGTSDPGSTSKDTSGTPATSSTPGGTDPGLGTSTGTYRTTCDGSGAIALDRDHFVDANDENQVLRVYRRGADGAPVHTVEVSELMGLDTDDEADIEDLARAGQRVYGITSHGRNTSGAIKSERYRFFGFDLEGGAADLKVVRVGQTANLLKDMLVASNWTTPDAAVLAALEKASRLGTPRDASLAPEVNGLNIEGLAVLPTADRRLAIGFRNPAPDGSALVVTLLNPDAALAGQTARFGEAIKLDLGGLRVRSMAWSPAHSAVLVLGGAKDTSSTFRLFKWAGTANTPPVAVKDIAASGGSPEAIVTYEGTRDVQILLDEGDRDVEGEPCKDAPATKRSFRDVIVHVD